MEITTYTDDFVRIKCKHAEIRVVYNQKIIITLPIKRPNHDHNSTVELEITNWPGEVVDEERFTVKKPIVRISDPRFVEVTI